MRIPSFTFYFQPDFGGTDGGYVEPLPVAIMAADPATGEVVVPIMEADHPAAPEWYSEEMASDVSQRIESFTKSALSGSISEVDVLGREITVEENPVVEADDVDAALVRLKDIHVDEPLGYRRAVYETFTIDYRPKEDRSDEHYPLAIFAYDVAGGRFTGIGLPEPNPFLPRLTRQQRRAIKRELEKLYTRLDRGDAQGALDNLDRPRFGVFKIDDYEASSPDEAMQMGLLDLTEITFGAQSA